MSNRASLLTWQQLRGPIELYLGEGHSPCHSRGGDTLRQHQGIHIRNGTGRPVRFHAHFAVDGHTQTRSSGPFYDGSSRGMSVPLRATDLGVQCEVRLDDGDWTTSFRECHVPHRTFERTVLTQQRARVAGVRLGGHN